MNTRRTNLWTCRRDHARCRTGSLRLGVDRLPDTVGLGMAMLAAACRPPAPDGPGTQWTLAASTHPESKGRKGKVRWPRCRGGGTAHRRAAPRRHSHTRTHSRTRSHTHTWTQGFPARRTGHTALTGLLEEADEHAGVQPPACSPGVSRLRDHLGHVHGNPQSWAPQRRRARNSP